MQIQIRLQRDRDGLRVNVQAAPAVEELFRSMCPEKDVEAVGLFGRYWSALRPEDQLTVYAFDSEKVQATGTVPGTGIDWSFVTVGQPLTEDRNRGGGLRVKGGPEPGYVNLSMLRLRGISQPGGVSFRYHGIIEEDQAKQLAENLHRASAAFWNRYLREFDITLRVMKED